LIKKVNKEKDLATSLKEQLAKSRARNAELEAQLKQKTQNGTTETNTLKKRKRIDLNDQEETKSKRGF
jgi:hypothetical protein